MVIFLCFLMIKFGIRLAGPCFLFYDPWDSWILQQSQYVYEHQSAAHRAVLTLLCLITTGHLGRIFSSFFLWILVFFCDYFWSIFIWLVLVFSSVILGILGFSSSHSMSLNIRARLTGPF